MKSGFPIRYQLRADSAKVKPLMAEKLPHRQRSIPLMHLNSGDRSPQANPNPTPGPWERATKIKHFDGKMTLMPGPFLSTLLRYVNLNELPGYFLDIV
jgi:hypothetical protein